MSSSPEREEVKEELLLNNKQVYGNDMHSVQRNCVCMQPCGDEIAVYSSSKRTTTHLYLLFEIKVCLL